MELLYDMHIHSCLSPCGSDDMTPQTIVDCAVAKELDVIALTDHNTSGNCRELFNCAKESGLVVLSGMELQTSEEIHVVCLFDTLEKSYEFDKYVSERLPQMENNPKIFGNQILFGENGTSEENRMLLVSSDISLYGLYGLLKSFGGVAIPAHIDRDSFSVKSVFGVLDKDMGFPLVEVWNDSSLADNANIPFIQSSDAHNIDAFFDREYHSLNADEKTAESVLKALYEASVNIQR